MIPDTAKNGGAVMAAVNVYHKAIQYILGEKGLPRILLPSSYGKPERELQSIIYATTAIDLWKSVPGAIDWLRKCRNTFWAVASVTHYPPKDAFPGYQRFSTFKRLLEEGVYDNCPVTQSGSFMIHELVMGPHTSPEHIRLYLSMGYRPSNSFHLSALNMACYYDVDPEIVAMLIDAGLSLLPKVPFPDTPLAMAANQVFSLSRIWSLKKKKTKTNQK